MTHCTDPFAAYYFSTHTGRKLYWQFQLGPSLLLTFSQLLGIRSFTSGSADLKGNFQDGKRELTVSTYQMFILLLFNQTDTLSLHDIRDQTGIPEMELRRHLLSLCTPKFKILNKMSKIKGIAEDDCFTFNQSYSSKLKRVKIPLISLKELGGVDEMEKAMATLPPSVEEDRRHLIEAAIVRIMKARKTLSHNDLMSETMRQSAHRFSVEAQVS
jgi:cullin 3